MLAAPVAAARFAACAAYMDASRFGKRSLHLTIKDLAAADIFTGDMLAKNFGVLREDSGLADRGTFVVDPDGAIQAEP